MLEDVSGEMVSGVVDKPLRRSRCPASGAPIKRMRRGFEISILYVLC